MSALAGALADKRVVICAGAGGVGKTTVSATLALGLAAEGRRVVVVTIDPARRLAEALGLGELGNEPSRVETGRLSDPGLEIKGELWAMMLDSKRTFDELIARLAPDESTRDQILRNRVYVHLTGRSPAPRSTRRWQSCSRSSAPVTTTWWSSTHHHRGMRSISSMPPSACSDS